VPNQLSATPKTMSYTHQPAQISEPPSPPTSDPPNQSARTDDLIPYKHIDITSFQPPRVIRWFTCTSNPFVGSRSSESFVSAVVLCVYMLSPPPRGATRMGYLIGYTEAAETFPGSNCYGMDFHSSAFMETLISYCAVQSPRFPKAQ
jgi:hypothetical protein